MKKCTEKEVDGERQGGRGKRFKTRLWLALFSSNAIKKQVIEIEKLIHNISTTVCMTNY